MILFAGPAALGIDSTRASRNSRRLPRAPTATRSPGVSAVNAHSSRTIATFCVPTSGSAAISSSAREKAECGSLASIPASSPRARRSARVTFHGSTGADACLSPADSRPFSHGTSTLRNSTSACTFTGALLASRKSGTICAASRGNSDGACATGGRPRRVSERSSGSVPLLASTVTAPSPAHASSRICAAISPAESSWGARTIDSEPGTRASSAQTVTSTPQRERSVKIAGHRPGRLRGSSVHSMASIPSGHTSLEAASPSSSA